MLFEHRDKEYRDPLDRMKAGNDPGSGQKAERLSMCRGYEEADDGTWRERCRQMLFDGSVLAIMNGAKEHCREVTGKGINKYGRWC